MILTRTAPQRARRGHPTARNHGWARALAASLTVLGLGCTAATGVAPERVAEPDADAQLDTTVSLPPIPIVPLPPPPVRPGPPSEIPPHVVPELARLVTSLGARDLDIDDPCVERIGDRCVRRALDRLYAKLDQRARGDDRVVRMLLLGDSHIAADYIAKTTRARLQSVFGDAGRGYVHAEQRDGYGGRRQSQRPGFTRRRMIDSGMGRGRYGISGHALVSTRVGGVLTYLLDGDRQLSLYLDGHPESAELVARVDDVRVARVEGVSASPTTRVTRIDLPAQARVLKLVATGTAVGLFGIDFLSGTPGITLDAVGPVGADASTYVFSDPDSFESHARALEPALVMLMLGGNDALRIRKGNATLADTEARFHLLLDRLQRASPTADCLLWGPMDAGLRTSGGIKSRSLIGELRDMLARIAAARGCAFYDLYAVMGEEGSIATWSKAGIMNQDLVHPRAKAGELIGHLFAEAFLRDYQRATP